MAWLALIGVVAVVIMGATVAAGAASDPGYDWHGFTFAQLTQTSSGVANNPPADLLPALSETALRLRLTLGEFPGARVTSVYRCHEVTVAIWPYNTPVPTWDWHGRAHAADVVVDDPKYLLEWSQASGLWCGADTMIEASHVHLAWK
jgi:hypothetical protein